MLAGQSHVKLSHILLIVECNWKPLNLKAIEDPPFLVPEVGELMESDCTHLKQRAANCLLAV